MITTELHAEQRQARLVASYLVPAVIWATVMVGIWCQHNTQRPPGELLTVMVAALVGSVGLTHLARILAPNAQPGVNQQV